MMSRARESLMDDKPAYLSVPDFQRVAIIGDFATGVSCDIRPSPSNPPTLHRYSAAMALTLDSLTGQTVT